LLQFFFNFLVVGCFFACVCFFLVFLLALLSFILLFFFNRLILFSQVFKELYQSLEVELVEVEGFIVFDEEVVVALQEVTHQLENAIFNGSLWNQLNFDELCNELNV